jgi:uncharacterized protein YutD
MIIIVKTYNTAYCNSLCVYFILKRSKPNLNLILVLQTSLGIFG